MGFDKAVVPRVMAAVRTQTRSVLASEANLDVEGVADCRWDAPALHLHRHTALAGLGGSLGLLVAFSFEPVLLDTLYDRLTAGLTDAAAETVNTVLGLSTSELLQHATEAIHLTPPVVLDQPRSLDRPVQATFASTEVRTGSGVLDITILAPFEAFHDLPTHQSKVRS